MKKEIFDIESNVNKFLNVLFEYTPKVIAALILLVIGLWLINRLAKISTKSMERRDLDVSLRTFLKSLISIGLKIVLIVTVAGMVGIGTTSFVTILGAAGLAVGLALQGSLSNFAGGVLILIFKPYKVGDSIDVLGQSGTVKEIQIFNTILLTGDLKTVILPNGSVSNGTIVNNTRYGILRGDVQVSVSAMHDIDWVKNLLFEEIIKHNLVLKDPKPEIYALKIIDGGVTLSIKSYADAGNLSLVNSDIVEIAKKIFDKHQILPPPPKK